MKGYRDWNINRWETPLSDVDITGLVLHDLVLNTFGLTISLESSQGLFRVRFKGHPPFRVIDEGYRGELWIKLHGEGKPKLGSTLIAENTDFIEFLKLDGFFESVASDYRHYLILTENDVVEVISKLKPEVEKLD